MRTCADAPAGTATATDAPDFRCISTITISARTTTATAAYTAHADVSMNCWKPFLASQHFAAMLRYWDASGRPGIISSALSNSGIEALHFPASYKFSALAQMGLNGPVSGVAPASRTNSIAVLIGTNQLNPWVVSAPAVAIPMTWPCWLKTGPPLLPWVIAASDWKRGVSILLFLIAEMCPFVALASKFDSWLIRLLRPHFDATPGKPITITGSWIFTLSESPSGTVGRSLPAIFKTDTSFPSPIGLSHCRILAV